MKINMFKIYTDKADDLREALENSGYCCEACSDDKMESWSFTSEENLRRTLAGYPIINRYWKQMNY